MDESTPSPVRLKGIGGYLYLYLNPDDPVDYLLAETDRLFTNLKTLAVNANVRIDTGKEKGHDDLIDVLTSSLTQKFKVAGVDRALPERMKQSKRPVVGGNDWTKHRSDVLLLTGRVRSGQKVAARKHLVILGDVNPGAEIIAGGDIIVMGQLGGKASAGQPGDETSIIIALMFKPIQVKIGNVMAAGLTDNSQQRSTVTEYAHVENGIIIVEDYIKSNPFRRNAWPEIR